MNVNATATKVYWNQIALGDRIADLRGEGWEKAAAERQAADEILERLFQHAGMREFNQTIRSSDLLQEAYRRATAPAPSCEDCGGLGVGCCINADIPLPGVEY